MGDVFARFPGGKVKAITLSYDDGGEQDIRLVEIMKKYGLKGTFNLNSGLYAPEGTVYPKGQIKRRMSKKMAQELFKDSGMEVAVHSYTHPNLTHLSQNICTMEIIKDREALEEDFDCIVRGMAYPNGGYNDEVVATLKQCGIVYARTIVSTHQFSLPNDWLRMPATCHHNDPKLMELSKTFLENKRNRSPLLFYLWGHGYEFDRDDNWHVIEKFAEYMGGREEIWYASNIEIYDYMAAYRQLLFTVNGKKVHNPTHTELYFETSAGIYAVKPGETICFER